VNANRIARIRDRLREALAPTALEIVDDSHHHIGHPGAADGRAHFRIRIVSDRFANLGRLERHRLVYEALGSMMRTDIHALQITALTSNEN
jgi:BolA protein